MTLISKNDSGIFQNIHYPNRFLVVNNILPKKEVALFAKKRGKYYYQSYLDGFHKADFRKIELDKDATKLLNNITNLFYECMKIVEESDDFFEFESRSRLLANMFNCPIDKIMFDKDDFRAMINIGM